MSPPAELGFTVTLRDLYDALVELKSEVQKVSPVVTTVSDHETRIRSLEKWRYAVPTSLVISGSSIAVAYYSSH